MEELTKLKITIKPEDYPFSKEGRQLRRRRQKEEETKMEEEVALPGS